MDAVSMADPKLCIRFGGFKINITFKIPDWKVWENDLFHEWVISLNVLNLSKISLNSFVYSVCFLDTCGEENL